MSLPVTLKWQVALTPLLTFWRSFQKVSTGAGHLTTNNICAWLVGGSHKSVRWGGDEILLVVMLIILATFITIRVGYWGWLHSARCGLEAIAGGTAKYGILCLSVLFIDAMGFNCTSIQEGERGLTVRGRWCHSCAESSSRLWHQWII